MPAGTGTVHAIVTYSPSGENSSLHSKVFSRPPTRKNWNELVESNAGNSSTVTLVCVHSPFP